LKIWHCNLSAELTKKRTASDCFFLAILPTGKEKQFEEYERTSHNPFWSMSDI